MKFTMWFLVIETFYAYKYLIKMTQARDLQVVTFNLI